MNYEEIMVKLGLDGSSLSKGVRELKGQLGELSEHGHAGFVHMGNAGRAFHKLMEQIKDTSPGAAAALQFVFTPVVGAIVAATAVLTFFNKKLEEMNAELDKASAENMKPLTDAWELQRKLSKGVNDDIAAQNKWLKDQKESHNDLLDSMKEQLATAKAQHEIDKKRALTKREQLALDVKDAETQFKITKDTHYKLQKDRDAAVKAEKKAASAYIEAPEREQLDKAQQMAPGAKERLDKAIKEQIALKVASAKATPEETEGFRLLPSWQEVKDMAGKLVGQEGLEGRLEKANQEVKDATEAYHKNTAQVDRFKEKMDELKDKLDQSKTTVSKLNAAFNATESDLRSAKVNLSTAQFAQRQGQSLSAFLPGIDQFAQAPGPLGNLARRIMATQTGIGNRLLMGDRAGAEQLRRSLQGYDVAGFDMPDWSKGGKLVHTSTHVKGLEEIWGDVMKQLLGKDGLPVQIVQTSE